jgi:hypothetical protein
MMEEIIDRASCQTVTVILLPKEAAIPYMRGLERSINRRRRMNEHRYL